MSASDTIVAIATPNGRGGIGVIRLSGAQSTMIASAILSRALPEPRTAIFSHFQDADHQTIDEGIAIFFAAPNSFTGEDVVELQGHGGPVILDLIVQRCIELGARLARPGEFSERAFLNDKLDLAQAEAIADLIDSGSAQAARSAIRSLQGDFSNQIKTLVDLLIKLRMYVEAALDFPEEEIDYLADQAVWDQLKTLDEELEAVLALAQQGSILREGMNLVLIGQPNVGKSSLLNCLAGKDAAIVTHVPGTTRDVLKEYIQLDGMPLHILDTAGLRESDDIVEQEGIRRTWAEIEKADLILLLIDHETGFSDEDQKILKQLSKEIPRLIVHNKIDLTGEAARKAEDILYLSAKTGEGISLLKTELKTVMGFQANTEGLIIARRRHLEALNTASQAIGLAKKELQNQSGELVAEHLRIAQEALGAIIGKFTSDDLLGEIFSSFCIGK